jgi:hypothetical protein
MAAGFVELIAGTRHLSPPIGLTMPGLLRSAWRSLFPRLQRSLPAHHGHPLLARLDRAATVFHQLYEIGHYDPSSNGEAWLLRQLAPLRPRVIFDVGANRGEYA